MLRGREGFLPPTVAGQEHEFDSLFEELFQKLGRRGEAGGTGSLGARAIGLWKGSEEERG